MNEASSSEDIQPLAVEAGSSVEQALSVDTPEAEKIPTWFNGVVNKITNAWFDPKSFEQNPRVYERLGVRTFKKYMPTGDLVSRHVWKMVGKPAWFESGNLGSLKSMERFTRLYESVHTTALAFGAAAMAYQLAEGKIEGAAFTAGLNMLVNVYPIMVQRYNRSRLYRAIHKMESR